MAPDQVTETTSEGLGSRLGNSLKGILFGIVLFVAAFPVLFWNEGRAVSEAKSIAEGAAATVLAAPDKVDPQKNDKLVHMTGKAQTEEVLTDSQFGVSANAIMLRRQVEMFQYREEKDSKTEKKLGGGTETKTTYRYPTAWSEDRIDSSEFKEPSHVNPPMPLASESMTASNVTVGAFTLPKTMVQKDSAFVSLIVTSDNVAKLPESLRSRAKLVDGGFYIAAGGAPSASPPATSASGDSLPAPKVGDIRVKFTMVPAGDVSLIAKQSGSSFVPYVTKQGMEIQLLVPGVKTAAQMWKAEQEASNLITWILRLVGFVAMGLGLAMVARPISVVADVVPFVGNIVGGVTGFLAFLIALPLTLITIAVAWVAYRPMVGIPVLAVGVAGVVFAFVLKSRKAKARKAAQT